MSAVTEFSFPGYGPEPSLGIAVIVDEHRLLLGDSPSNPSTSVLSAPESAVEQALLRVHAPADADVLVVGSVAGDESTVWKLDRETRTTSSVPIALDLPLREALDSFRRLAAGSSDEARRGQSIRHSKPSGMWGVRKRRASRETEPTSSLAAPNRLEHQIERYSGKSAANRRAFFAVKSSEMLAAAAVPVVVALHGVVSLIAATGVVIVLLEAVLQLGRFRTNWHRYRANAALLTQEKYLYLSEAGVYRTQPDPQRLLAERVEALVTADARERPDVWESPPTTQAGDKLPNDAQEASDPARDLERLIAWYRHKSATNRRAFVGLRVSDLLAAAAIPVMAIAHAVGWLAGGLGCLVLVLESVVQAGQFQSNWRVYGSAAEALTQERYLFVSSAGPYSGSNDPARLLAERVEMVVAQNETRWVTDPEPQFSSITRT
jgi:Protein of unknown function (DUF4231)